MSYIVTPENSLSHDNQLFSPGEEVPGLSKEQVERLTELGVIIKTADNKPRDK